MQFATVQSRPQTLLDAAPLFANIHHDGSVDLNDDGTFGQCVEPTGQPSPGLSQGGAQNLYLELQQ